MDSMGATMETTRQTREYQDPLESEIEKRFPWTFVFTTAESDAAVHIVADDRSGREFALPAGAIIEIARLLKQRRQIAG
jgi:hypothetical protein